MKAMILAAGLGTRMRPLTHHTPKPLLKAGDKWLIEYHLNALRRAGIKDVVINTHWLGAQIENALGSGQTWGLNITYSRESVLLETAGGISAALPHLIQQKQDVFLVINGDVYCELDLAMWVNAHKHFAQGQVAHLALTANPVQHPDGDFIIDKDGVTLRNKDNTSANTYTYTGIALYRGEGFSNLATTPQPLGPLLRHWIQEKRVTGDVIEAHWMDIGTPERLAQLDHRLQNLR